MESEKTRLLEGILESAHKEADKILAAARTACEDMKKTTSLREKELYQAQEEKALRQISQLKRNSDYAMELAERRQDLKLREAVLAKVRGRLEELLRDLSSQGDYRQVLMDWVLEAMLGLDCREALVSASAAEIALMDEDFLSEVMSRYKEATGRECLLRLSEAGTEQGPLVTAADGGTAYSNQVASRLLRHEQEIRRLVYGKIFT